MLSLSLRKKSVRSDRDFPADFDDRFDRQFEIFGQVSGVALHKGEQCLHPSRQGFLVLTGHDRLVANIISDVREIDGASTLVRLLEQRRNVWPLHETVASSRAPEAGCDLSEGKPLGVLDPRHRPRT